MNDYKRDFCQAVIQMRRARVARTDTGAPGDDQPGQIRETTVSGAGGFAVGVIVGLIGGLMWGGELGRRSAHESGI